MEDEVRSILVPAACEPCVKYGLGDRIHALFEGIGDDFAIPERGKGLPRAAPTATEMAGSDSRTGQA
jgi:hypothetical protein